MRTAEGLTSSLSGNSIASPDPCRTCCEHWTPFASSGLNLSRSPKSLDTATPAGRMVFTVLGAVAELERSLIVERVKAGLRNARAKGKRLGRPRKVLPDSRIASLRARGCSWRTIARQIGASARTCRRAWQKASWVSFAPSSDALPGASGCALAPRVHCNPQRAGNRRPECATCHFREIKRGKV